MYVSIEYGLELCKQLNPILKAHGYNTFKLYPVNGHPDICIMTIPR